jgi:nucleotide-binding universal stress UspA family protein
MEEYLLHNAWHRVPRSEVRRIVAAEENEHREALNATIQESGIGGDITIRHVRGNPERVIPEIVDEAGVDILVMGTVARTGVPGFVIGNTAENVLRRLDCSLLALKPPGFTSPIKP